MRGGDVVENRQLTQGKRVHPSLFFELRGAILSKMSIFKLEQYVHVYLNILYVFSNVSALRAEFSEEMQKKSGGRFGGNWRPSISEIGFSFKKECGRSFR